jgi:hypothetical protein
MWTENYDQSQKLAELRSWQAFSLARQTTALARAFPTGPESEAIVFLISGGISTE